MGNAIVKIRFHPHIHQLIQIIRKIDQHIHTVGMKFVILLIIVMRDGMAQSNLKIYVVFECWSVEYKASYT